MSERENRAFFLFSVRRLHRVLRMACALHCLIARKRPRRKGKQVMANGEVWIEITAQDGGYDYKEAGNTTEGSVVFEMEDKGLILAADPGIYAFTFIAVNFEFAANAVAWAQPGGNRNLTWAS